MTAVFECHSVSKSFGGLKAVDDVSLSVPAGTISALIGPNGAGKTTLFNIATNLLSPSSGDVLFFGKNVRGWPLHELAAMGVVRTFQSARVFSGMTALDNVLSGAHLHCRTPTLLQMLWSSRAISEERHLASKAEGLLDSVGLLAYRDATATDLPIGVQKLVEILRALMAGPKLLLLDEPAAGLNDRETSDLARFLIALRNLGIAILVVEHNMSLVMDVASNIFVLDAGRLVASGSPDAIRRNEFVIEAYLGKTKK